MPALSSPTDWRKHPHRINGYLVVYAPAPVLTCLVNQSTFPNPLTDITYDNVTYGSYANVRPGMLVRFTSGGNVIGYGRIRKAPSSTVLFVGALAYGELQLSDNDTIDVLNDYRLQAKIPRIDASSPLAATFYKDFDIAYSNQGHYLPPVSNVGPHTAGFVDDTGYLFVSCRGAANSYAMASGASIVSYSNNIVDGTYVTGSNASGNFDAKFPAGERWVTLTVTDSNGITHTAYRFIKACERTGTHAPLSATTSRLRYSPDSISAEFTILASDAGEDVIPPGSLVIYFEEETYGVAGDKVSGSLNAYDYANVTYTGYAGVKFVGWVTEAAERIYPLMDDLTITATGPTGILATLPMFSSTLSHAASASGWYDLEDLTLWRAIWYLLYWHTTAFEVCDFIRPAWYATYPYIRFDSSSGNAYPSIDNLTQYVNARFTCDRMGNLFAPRSPQLMDGTDRGGVETIVTLADGDWSEGDIREVDSSANYWTRGSGLLASQTTVTPFLSIAPGQSPGQGAIEDQLNNQLVLSQADLNVRTGRQHALKNNKYPSLSISILNAGSVIDQAWGGYVTFILGASYTKRQIGLSGHWIPREVTYEYDANVGAASESWVIEPEAFGVPGETLPVPVEAIDDIGYVGMPEWNPMLEDLYDPRPDPVLEYAAAPAAYMLHAGYLTRTRNHVDASPSWEIVFTVADVEALFSFPQNGGISSLGFRGMALDPWNPKMAAYIFMHHGYGSRNAWVIYVTNLDGAPGTQVFTRVMNDTGSAYQLTFHSMIFASINVDGALMIPSLFNTGGNGAWVRTSKVASMVRYQALNGNGLYGPGAACGTHMASAGNGIVYMSTYGTHAYADRVLVFRSLAMATDWGSAQVPWLDFVSYAGGALVNKYPTSLHAPYEDNASDAVLYIGIQCDLIQSLIRHNADTSMDDIGPLYSGHYYAPVTTHSYVGDRHLMALIGKIGTGGTDYRLFTTDDGGDTWLDRNTPASVATSILTGLWGWPYDEDVMVTSIGSGADRGIWWCNDLLSASQYGVTWANFLGDWETVTGATFTAPYNYVPVWVP